MFEVGRRDLKSVAEGAVKLASLVEYFITLAGINPRTHEPGFFFSSVFYL